MPHRPMHKVMIYIAFFAVLLVCSAFTYQLGQERGMKLGTELQSERDRLYASLEAAEQNIEGMRQQIADLELGGVIDDRANEEVRQTIEALQNQIAEQNEEISFYKGVMLPNVADKGLRIERLDMSSNGQGRVKYSLLLTQVVDKHDFVQGDVDLLVRGQAGEEEKSFDLKDLDEGKDSDIRFRFRYFQNINGELTLPDGFEPHEVTIVAQSSGSKGQRLEKSFDWPLQGG